jgi:hypothetical protein
MWSARCDCGNVGVYSRNDLCRSKGATISCGCARTERCAEMGRRTAAANSRAGASKGAAARTTHGHSGRRRTATYATWEAIKSRCHTPSHSSFAEYGGRGIAVCERWRESFESFLADMGTRPPGLTIDRIDGARGYEPGNCRWASYAEQNRNLRTNRILRHDGREMCLADWALETGLTATCISSRLRRRWPIAEALSFAPHARGRAPDTFARGDRSGARRHPDRILRGEKSPRAKLTARDVEDVRRNCASGSTQAAEAARLGVSKGTIGFITRGETWRTAC